MTVKAINRKGPARGVLDANQEWLNMFSARERNALLKNVWRRVINEWRFKFLKRRLEAKTVLRPPFNYELDMESPMLESGYMAKKAIWKGKIKTTAKRSRAGTQEVKGFLGLPFGHAVPRAISEVFRVLPPDEVQWMAERLAELFINERERAIDTTSRRKNARPRLSLSPGQRKRFAVKKRRGRRQ